MIISGENIILLFYVFKEKLLLINTNNKYSNIILLAININYVNVCVCNIYETIQLIYECNL